MITINRVRLQGTESITLVKDTVWRGRSGETLWMSKVGVKTLRVGEDLVLWIPSDLSNDQGQPVYVRLQWTGFFKMDDTTQVIILASDTPIQMFTPSSKVLEAKDMDEAVAMFTGDLAALGGEAASSSMLTHAGLMTQSSDLDLQTLLALNPTAELPWLNGITQSHDTTLTVKLPGVNPPTAPVLFGLSHVLTDPNGKGVAAVNKPMAIAGYTVNGQSDRNNAVTLVLTSETTGDTATFKSYADVSGKFSIPLTYKGLKGIPTGYYSVKVYAEDSLKAQSPESEKHVLYVDVIPPDLVKFDWTESKINLNSAFINRALIAEDAPACQIFGTAEPLSLVKFEWMNKAGILNPGLDQVYTCQTDAQGHWSWTLTPEMAKGLAIKGDGKTQVLNVQVTAMDNLGNVSLPMVFANVGLDLVAPDVPTFSLSLDNLLQIDGQTYPTLNKVSLDRSSVLSGDLFKEPGGKVNVRLVQKDDPSIQAQINNLLVDNDGSWLFKPKITQFNGLKSGEYLVMVQGVDAAGNISDWSSAQSLYLDVTEPSLPTIDRLPTLSTTVDVEGNELSVVNNVSLQDSSKVFSGQAEPSSKVTLTLFDSRLPPGVIIKTVVADAVDGSWSLTLNLQEWQSLSEGVIACKVKSTDASGNVSRESDPKRFYMDLTPPANPGVELSDSVVLRVNPQYPTIRFLNLEDFQNGTWIQGTGEKGNKITLEINGQLVDSSIVVDSNNNWRYMLVNTPQKNWAQLLPDGVLTIEVQAIDLVKNPSQKVSYQRFVIEKHTQLPSPPTDLGLVPGEDTGRPNETQTLVDQKTNKQAPKLQWKIPNNTQTFIWFDANDNGQLEPEEKTPVAVPVGMIQNNMVTYQLQLLKEGRSTFFVCTQDEWGNYSPTQSISLTLDKTISNPLFDGFQGDNNLSLKEYLDRENIRLSGSTEEENCVITLQLLDSKSDPIPGIAPVEVKTNGYLWSANQFFKNLNLTKNGSFILRIVSTDEAGNSTKDTPLDIAINIRSTPLPEVAVVKLSNNSDTGNVRPGTTSDNITANQAPRLTGFVPLDTDADLIVRLFNSEGVQLIADNDSALDSTGQFDFQLNPTWLTSGQPVKFVLKTYDRLTGTEGEVSKEVTITLDQNYDVSAFSIGTVTDDNKINYDEFNSVDARPMLQGTSEVNTEITIVLSRIVGNQSITYTIPSSQVVYALGADGKEHWSAEFTQAMGNLLGDGQIKMQVQAKDRAGNIYNPPAVFFDLKRGQLSAPVMLTLSPQDDTGVSSSDHITQGGSVPGQPSQHQVTISGDTKTTSLVEVKVFNDKNKNGVFDTGDTLIDTFDQQGTSAFSKAYSFVDGEYNLRYSLTDRSSGQSSAPSDMLTITIDNSVSPPSNVVVGLNGPLNLLTYENGTTVILGKGEPYAKLFIQVQDKLTGQALLTTPWEVTVGADGNWRLNLSKAQLDQLQEGQLVAVFTQQDRAGNVSQSTQVDTWFDITPPDVPDVQLIADTLNNYYQNQNKPKPWDRPNQGVIWTDIFQYDSSTQTSKPQAITLAVALPANTTTKAQVKVGDTLQVSWGQQTIQPVTVNAQDLARGYVLVLVDGQKIDSEGRSDALSVKAFFTDALGNKSAEFTVLDHIKVSLGFKSPSLDLSISAHQNLGDPTGLDKTWYSNQTTAFTFKGIADPGAVVKIYAKRVDGTGTEVLLATVNAAPDTGDFNAVVNLSQSLTSSVSYQIQAESVLGNVSSVRSNVQTLNVNVAVVSLPTFDNTLLGVDGYVNSLERSDGVPITGKNAPAFAKIEIKMTNLNTGVVHTVDPFYANAQGVWSYALGIIDWGVVGEGKIQVEVKQSNLYGDSSAYKALPNTVVFDATVVEPTLNVVAGDQYLNGLEHDNLSNSTLKLSGSAEAGAQLQIKLIGANGFIYQPTTAPTVAPDRTWVLNLTQSIIDKLGPGKVSVVLSQTDLAGNVSVPTKNTFFTIDLSADGLTLGSVTADNVVSDVERDQGVSLTGNAEPGAWVQITLKQTGQADVLLPGFVANNGNWSLIVNKTNLSGFVDGQVTVQIQQTDVAGNSAMISKAFEIRSSTISESIIFTNWSGVPLISLTDQSTNYTLKGIGPANSELHLQIKKSDGSKVDLPVVNIDANGVWQLTLTPQQMVNWQGQQTLRYWALRLDQSTLIKELSLLIDSNFPSPTVDEVGDDSNISLADVLDSPDETLKISGTGQAYATVTVSFKGNANVSLPSKDVVVDSKTKIWSVTLTKAELIHLTNQSGKVTLSVVQTDNNSNRTSIVVNKSFDVDLLAPSLPTLAEQADAKGFNTTPGSQSSSAADGTVSDVDAKAGVEIAVPIAKVNGSFVLTSGDSITIVWGDQSYTKILTLADIPTNKNFLIVRVPLDTIAKAGPSNQLNVSVIYSDKSGNRSAPLTLIGNLVVTPPPDAPSIDIVGQDGFINRDEMVVLSTDPKGLVISGQSTEHDGKVNLVFTTIKDPLNPIKTLNEVVVQSNGKWTTSLSYDLLNQWSDGQYLVFATYTVSGRTSSVAKSVFEIDRVSPNAPLSIMVNVAAQENAMSELSGGLIRPWLNGQGPNGHSAQDDRYDTTMVTEAAKDVNVRVALPANVKIGDFVQLTWGDSPPKGVDNTVSQSVSNADISLGYMVVKVGTALISQMGDFNGNHKLTIWAQFFDSAKNPGPIQEVIKGLEVDAVPLPVTDVSTSFGDWLNLQSAKSGWRFMGQCDPGAEIELTMVGSSGYVTPPIRLWKNSQQQLLTSDGQWSLSDGLSEVLARQLGEGLVLVSIRQRDSQGNPSAPYETSFHIDLTPPPAPPTQDIGKLTYANYSFGKTIEGSREKNARVQVYCKLLNSQNQVVDTTDKREAILNDSSWTLTLEQQVFDTFLTKLPPGATGGLVEVHVVQIDLAGNESSETIKTFGFESQPLPTPVITQVSGLQFSAIPEDNVLSLADFTANPQITVSGTTTVTNGRIHLVLQKVNGGQLSWDIALSPNSSAWSKTLTQADVSSLGDGQYQWQVSVQQFDANGNLDNESLSGRLVFPSLQDYFVVDTHGPVCQSMAISANGNQGNAKLNDRLAVTLVFSENLQVDTSLGSPSVLLTGFSDGVDRQAVFMSMNYQQVKSNQMRFELVVGAGFNAPTGQLSVKSVNWNNAVVTDLYGNVKSNTMPSVTLPHDVLVDTEAPTYQPVIDSIAGTDSATPGGAFIINREAGNVTVKVSLVGFPNTEPGSNLILTWNGVDLPAHLVTNDDITNNGVDLAVDKTLLDGLETTVQVSVSLMDRSGNLSVPLPPTLVNIDTILPGAMTVQTWLTDNLLNAAEYANDLPDITGLGVEANTTVTAKIYYKKNGNTLSSPPFTVTLGANGAWSIAGSTIKTFLDSAVDYGPFELRVYQTDVHGNDSQLTTQMYFLDKDVPNPPLSVDMPSVSDGWLNAVEASRLEMRIYFDSNHAPKANDKLSVQFWKYAYKQAQRPVNVAPDFSMPDDLLITDADIVAGYKLVTLYTSLLQQDSTQTQVQEIDFEFKITDQGNNVSSVFRKTAHLDTQIKLPVVSLDPTTVIGGVTPAGALSNQHFKGNGVELLVSPTTNQNQVLPNSTNLTIIFRSQYGNKLTFTNVPYDTTNGSFDQILTPNDFKTLVGAGHTEAVVYYEVFQTDQAGNVSGKVVDSFNVSLAISPPVLQSFTGDNIVNLVELTQSQKLIGLTVPTSTVSVQLYAWVNQVAVAIGSPKVAIADAKGEWFVSFTVAELNALTANQSTNFSAYFEAISSKSGQQSDPARMDFQVVRSVPALNGTLLKFDANGDGANKDGLELTLTDAVLVRDLLADLKAKGMSSGLWGRNFRVEAVDSVKLNGDLYAKVFRIYLGIDHGLNSTTPIVLSRNSLINLGNNLPSTDLTLIPPSFFTPVTLSMQALKSGDNMINLNELAGLTTFSLYLNDDRVGFKPSSGDKYTVFLDGVKVSGLTDRFLSDFGTSFNSTTWSSTPPTLSLTMGGTNSSQIYLDGRQGVHTLTAQLYSPTSQSSGYYSVTQLFLVDTEVQTDVRHIKVVDTDGNGQVSTGDKIILEFAEAVNFQVTDLPSINVNGVAQLVFGQNAMLKPIGGHYTPYTQDISLSSKTQAQAQDWVDSMFKSTVWEITLGNNPIFNPGDTFQLSNLLDHAGNRSSSFSVNTSTDLYNRPTSVLIDVVSKDNVISANDLTQTTTVSVKLVGAKVGDVVKLYMDGTSVVNQIGKSMGNTDPNVKVESITVTQADLNANSVTFQLSANDWGGDGLRNLNATIQRGNGSVVSSDMRNVFVSTTADHWSSTGKIIWFDTDNIVQETGTNVTSWDASVGGSVAKSFKSAYNSYPMLVRNSVNGHNQLYFNGADYVYNYITKTWTVSTTDSGAPTQRKGAFMYFNDPQNLFANYNRSIPDVVPTKESYTVIANGRKDNALDGMLTSIGANGSSNLGYNGGDFKLVTGNVGLAVWGGSYISAYQGQNRTDYTNYSGNLNTNISSAYTWDYPYYKPGPLSDLGFNPTKTTYANGMVEPMNSANLGMQLLLSHVYDTTPYGNSNMGDVSLFSNAELIGHRNTDYKIVLGGGKPAGNLSYLSDNDPQYQAIMSTQFLIGAMNQTNIAPNSMNDIGQNVNYLWRGMIGDIIWSAKAIKGAALEEINMYQAVKFGTVGYLNEPKSRGNTYDLSKTADKINLLDDILLLNQTADSGNGDETVTVAGADFVTTGNGSDTLILKDLAFRYLDGGKGEDVLRLDASFNTSNTIYLSDYVSNARGMVGTSDDNARVNLNGFHKLMGIETIDLSSNTKAQTLSISADDVWQLSDTHSLKIKMDSQDLLLTQNLGSQLQGHFYLDVTGSWYDSYYSPNTAQSMTLYTQGGDTLTRMVSFDLSNNNKILDLNFDHTLKVNVGSTLQIGDFSISGLGPYTFAAGGVNSSNPTTVSFNDLQQSLRFQSTDSINGPVLITYNGNQLQDSQGRVLPSYTWMIGSDAPNQDYDQYKVLNANQLSLSTQKKGVMMLGGGGEDLLVGALGADTLVGGLDSDTLIGGDGSDTFVFAQESGDIAGPTGDVIQDFNLGKNGGLQSDTLSLYHLFDTALVNQLGKGSVNDAAKLANYLKFEWTHDANNLQLVCSIDTTGQGHFSKLVTMTDLLDSVGTVNYDASKPDQTRLYGGETSNALLQKLLEEGRLVIQ